MEQPLTSPVTQRCVKINKYTSIELYKNVATHKYPVDAIIYFKNNTIGKMRYKLTWEVYLFIVAVLLYLRRLFETTAMVRTKTRYGHQTTKTHIFECASCSLYKTYS